MFPVDAENYRRMPLLSAKVDSLMQCKAKKRGPLWVLIQMLGAHLGSIRRQLTKDRLLQYSLGQPGPPPHQRVQASVRWMLQWHVENFHEVPRAVMEGTQGFELWNPMHGDAANRFHNVLTKAWNAEVTEVALAPNNIKDEKVTAVYISMGLPRVKRQREVILRLKYLLVVHQVLPTLQNQRLEAVQQLRTDLEEYAESHDRREFWSGVRRHVNKYDKLKAQDFQQDSLRQFALRQVEASEDEESYSEASSSTYPSVDSFPRPHPNVFTREVLNNAHQASKLRRLFRQRDYTSDEESSSQPASEDASESSDLPENSSEEEDSDAEDSDDGGGDDGAGLNMAPTPDSHEGSDGSSRNTASDAQGVEGFTDEEEWDEMVNASSGSRGRRPMQVVDICSSSSAEDVVPRSASRPLPPGVSVEDLNPYLHYDVDKKEYVTITPNIREILGYNTDSADTVQFDSDTQPLDVDSDAGYLAYPTMMGYSQQERRLEQPSQPSVRAHISKA